MKNNFLNDFNSFLESKITGKGEVEDSIRYSLISDGKRLRPLLLLSLLKDYNYDFKKGIAIAAAVEMIHTYSLIHDDLPAMDNDDIRRGKATNHLKFSESTAILAGDALQPLAYKTIFDASYSNEVKLKLAHYFSEYIGVNGLIKGQELDLKNQNNVIKLDELKKISSLKTGKLFSLALISAAIIAEHDSDIELLDDLGKNLGIAFQIQDDYLEATSKIKEIGKSKSDTKNMKHTFYTELQNKTLDEMENYYKKCYNIINQLDLQNNLLNILQTMQYRTK